jgi:hypothetical protein
VNSILQQLLSPADEGRASRVFDVLSRHEIEGWALTGGFAIEIHHLRLGHRPGIRHLNDIDFIADSFACIPETLTSDFLFRHVHPLDPPNRTMLQMIEPQSAVRVDIFRAYGATMSRASRLDLPSGAVRLISLEDLVARTARLALDLAEGVLTPSKHALDFLRLAKLVESADVEVAWRDQRKQKHPESFDEANRVLHDLISARQNLLITPEYSKRIDEVCPRCLPASTFQLADPATVLSLLGYC